MKRISIYVIFLSLLCLSGCTIFPKKSTTKPEGMSSDLYETIIEEISTCQLSNEMTDKEIISKLGNAGFFAADSDALVPMTNGEKLNIDQPFHFYQVNEDCTMLCFAYKDGMLYNTFIDLSKAEPIVDFTISQARHLQMTSHGYLVFESYIEGSAASHEINSYYDYRVTPFDTQLHDYDLTYIYPVGYECHNLFSSTWDNTNLSSLDFISFYDEFYEMKYQTRFLVSDDLQSKTQRLCYDIPAQDFESVIQTYINVPLSTLHQLNTYDASMNTYLYCPASCIKSHYATPVLRGEVKEATRIDEQTLVLTVDALANEFGYDYAFTHRLTIHLDPDGSFQYISNEVIDSPDNQFPPY